MKSLIFAVILFSSQAFASYNISCTSAKAFQQGTGDMLSEAQLTFQLVPHGNGSVINNINGHIFVKSPLENSNPTFSSNDTYMGYFQIPTLSANADYRPNKYEGYAQFKNFNATQTTGEESGMWGYLAIDVTGRSEKLNAVYVFQAGDHMGGTVLLECEIE